MPEHLTINLGVPEDHPDRERRVQGENQDVVKAQRELQALEASRVEKEKARSKLIGQLRKHDDPVLQALAEHL